MVNQANKVTSMQRSAIFCARSPMPGRAGCGPAQDKEGDRFTNILDWFSFYRGSPPLWRTVQ